jgi:TolB-like protein/Tfp pilus assembly protein PilF
VPDSASVRGLGGRYSIERAIGEGGMGRVFAARDLKLDRNVAIKLLQTGAHSDEALRRFEEEARAAGSLQHPNVLIVHDIGACEDGPYIVSELLQGATLRERMHGKALPVGKAVDYALQLAQGLRAAHGKGVIHRDLKPENLFVTHEGRLKILDFGIAKLGERRDLPRRTTDEGAILGTVAYMSPEQIRGQRADARSDIFAFGSILHEMLSGRRAFERESQMETGAAILNDEPAELPAQVPAPLQGIVWRCLEKDPKDRFQSAADLAVELSAYGGVRVRRGRLAIFAVAATLAAAGIFLLKDRPLPVVAAERSSIAVLPFANLSSDSENEYFSDGITEELINALANVDGVRVASRTSSFAFKGKRISAGEIGQQLKVASLLEGSVRREGNQLRVFAQLIDTNNGFHVWSKSYDRELKNVLAVEDELAQSIAQALRPSLKVTKPLVRHTTASTEAHDLYLRARYFWNDRTEPGLRKAIALYHQAIGVDPDYALANAALADSYMLLRNYAPADDPGKLLSKAKLYAEKAVEADDMLAEAHTSLASIAEADFDWKTAEREHRRAIELKPDYARAHHWYGLLLRDLGRFDEADKELARALQLDPASMPIRIIIAANRYFRRDYDQAIDQLTKLRELAVDQPIVPLLLAATYLHKGRNADAVATVDETVSQNDGNSGWLSIRGYIHARAGDRTEALRVLAELEQRGQREFVARADLALIHSGLGNVDKSFALLNDAHARREPTLASLKVDPLWDSLRSDPRFRRLLSRANFE